MNNLSAQSTVPNSAESARVYRQWATNVNATLEKIQHVDNPRELHFTHDPFGLGGQISRRIFALRIAMLTGARAVFPSENMFPYRLPFQPFATSERIAGGTIASLTEAMREGEWVKNFDFRKLNEDELAFRQAFLLPSRLPAVPPAAAQLLYDGLLLSKQTLIPEYEARIKIAKANLGLERPYIGLHFRRGDKKLETPYVPAGHYARALAAEIDRTGITCVYVASDSPDVLRSVRFPPNCDIIFDRQERRYNNANHRFLIANPQLSDQETFTAVKNIFLLSQAKCIVGQDNAHFATLAAGAIAFRHLDPNCGTLLRGGALLDYKIWRSYYSIKWAFRREIKRAIRSFSGGRSRKAG